MHNWLMAILFFLPAGVANATPVVANKIPLLKQWRTPLDFGMTWRGKRLLGNNKTWRGFITGTLFAGLTAMLLSPFVTNEDGLWVALGLGLLMGCGALLGDAVESFIKRRRGVPSGASWFPFDQTDYIIGGLLLVAPFADISAKTIGVIFVTYFALHLIVAYIAYLLGLKERPI